MLHLSLGVDTRKGLVREEDDGGAIAAIRV